MQSLRRSVKESLYNIFWGLLLSVTANYVYLWAAGYEPKFHDMTGLAALMTLLSFIRSLVIRRWMNRGDGEGK